MNLVIAAHEAARRMVADAEKKAQAMRDQGTAPALRGGSSDFDSERWRVVRPNMDKERCTDCGACIEFCPMGTIYADGAVIRIRYESCIGCGVCAVDCRIHAIKMEPTSDQHR